MTVTDLGGFFLLLPSARHLKALCLSRTGFAGLTTALLLTGAGTVKDATAQNETRTLSFYHSHSRESVTVTFKTNGRYNEAALGQLNHFLRDWRSQDKTKMDRHLFDILWEVYRDVDASQPINIVSAYRSPSTNAMLRRRSSGVARSSQHMLGHAVDFYIPGVALEKIRNAGLRLQRGGVGFYPTSGSPFVHLDTGSIRHWPRMTHDQLARVFPNGRTVHVPTNGTPLPGYQLALADVQRRRNGDSASSSSSSSSEACWRRCSTARGRRMTRIRRSWSLQQRRPAARPFRPSQRRCQPLQLWNALPRTFRCRGRNPPSPFRFRSHRSSA